MWRKRVVLGLLFFVTPYVLQLDFHVTLEKGKQNPEIQPTLHPWANSGGTRTMMNIIF
jgi:hypothetical protein